MRTGLEKASGSNRSLRDLRLPSITCAAAMGKFFPSIGKMF
jgi:hypothetical protein